MLDEFLLRLYNSAKSIVPKRLVQEVQSILDADIVLSINGKTIEATHMLSELKMIEPIGAGKYSVPSIQTIQNDSLVNHILNHKVYSSLYFGLVFGFRVTFVTTMYMCYQIELVANEYILYAPTVLYLKKLDIILYDGQFVYFYDK